MTQVSEAEQPQNPNSHSQFDSLTLQPENPEEEMKPDSTTHDPFPVRSPRSRTAITFSRKKRKKTGRNPKAAQKKLETLRQTLNPIPFVPAKTLDFAAHEDLLKRLGLWDFVHLKFDRSIRADLLAQLIVNYNVQLRCSYVNEYRVNLNRTDLGRALKLPVMAKSKKSVEVSEEEVAVETVESIVFLEDLVSNWLLLHEDMWMMPPEVLSYTKAIREGQFGKVDWAGLVWYMVSEELARAPRQLENCYYASHLQHLMKSQREEELFSVKKEEKVEIDLKDDDDDEEEDEDVKMEDVELCLGRENVGDVEVEGGDSERVNVEVEGVESGNVEGENVEGGNVEGENVEGGNVEGENVEEVDVGKESVKEDEAEEGNAEKVEAEEENAEKGDGEEENEEKGEAEEENAEKFDAEVESADKVEAEQENLEKVHGEAEPVEVEDEDDVMEFEEYKEAGQWGLTGKETLGEPCLQRCNLGGVKDFGCGDERNKDMEFGDGVGEGEQEEDEIEEEEEEEEDDDQEGGFHLLPKGFSLEGFPSGNLTQGMDGMALRDHFGGLEFPSPRDLMLPGSSSGYGNGPKREISHENDSSDHGLNGNKRLRTEGSWDGKMSGDFETSMDQIQQWMGRMEDMQQWMGKARMLYAAKESECQQASVNQQFLMQELQKRDELIEHLHKARFEDQQKLQTEKFRFEHEVHLMKNLLDGYRNALKATQRSFAEYRVRNPEAVEPLYRDVPGSGGLVLSTTELEKLRLKQEEEERKKRLEIETMINDFEGEWIGRYENHHKRIEILNGKLMGAEKEVKFLKGRLLLQRVPETQESAPNEAGDAWLGSLGRANADYGSKAGYMDANPMSGSGSESSSVGRRSKKNGCLEQEADALKYVDSKFRTSNLSASIRCKVVT